MKKEIKQKVVKYPVYIADDGKEFDNREDALIHDKLIHGKIKECPECHGKGQVLEEQEYDNYHTGVPEKSTFFVTCTRCKGKGYLEKKVTWE